MISILDFDAPSRLRTWIVVQKKTPPLSIFENYHQSLCLSIDKMKDERSSGTRITTHGHTARCTPDLFIFVCLLSDAHTGAPTSHEFT